MGIERTTFLIDEEGKIVRIYKNISPRNMRKHAYCI